MSAKNYPPVASQRKWSRILGVDYSTIWRNVKSGKIPAERAPDGSVQISLESIENWVRSKLEAGR